MKVWSKKIEYWFQNWKLLNLYPNIQTQIVVSSVRRIKLYTTSGEISQFHTAEDCRRVSFVFRKHGYEADWFLKPLQLRRQHHPMQQMHRRTLFSKHTQSSNMPERETKRCFLTPKLDSEGQRLESTHLGTVGATPHYRHLSSLGTKFR
jgi:hypothetical protein